MGKIGVLSTVVVLSVTLVIFGQGSALSKNLTKNPIPEMGEWQTIQSRCAPSTASEPALYATDFKWGYERAQMIAHFTTIYDSGKRLPKRAYYDTTQKKFILPGDPSFGGDVELSERLIYSVRRHIEEALRLKYVDAIFFPDMGHSHYFIPQEHWEKTYAHFPASQFNVLFTKLFQDPYLKVLYHTAEQLQTMSADQLPLSDKDLQWRYYTRNIVGDNRGQGHLELHPNYIDSAANTAREYEGHFYWGGGFNLSASKNGCFPYTFKGQTYYFDLSLFDLVSDAVSDN